MILRRRGLAERVLSSVSLVLATLARSYIDGLTGYSHIGQPTSARAMEWLNLWVGRLAGACTRSVRDAMNYETTLEELEASWRKRLSPIRTNSATDRILQVLPDAPVLTANSVAKFFSRTFKPANEAILRLVDADILRQVNVGRRDRPTSRRRSSLHSRHSNAIRDASVFGDKRDGAVTGYPFRGFRGWRDSPRVSMSTYSASLRSRAAECFTALSR